MLGKLIPITIQLPRIENTLMIFGMENIQMKLCKK